MTMLTQLQIIAEKGYHRAMALNMGIQPRLRHEKYTAQTHRSEG